MARGGAAAAAAVAAVSLLAVVATLATLAAYPRPPAGPEDLLDLYVEHVGGRGRARREAKGPAVAWKRSAWLDRDATAVRLSWAVGDGVLLMRVEARTLGWVGVGFSPGGGMDGADMAVGWVEDGADGRPHVLDCHGAGRAAAPRVDAAQNYELLRGAQNGSHTVLVLRRPLDSCDPAGDLVLGDDTARVIWALGATDPPPEAAAAAAGAVPGLQYHGGALRGARSLHLTAPAPPPPPAPARARSTWEVRVDNVTVPGDMDTLYWCRIFRAPPLPRKHHITGFRPAVEAGHAPLVHHMLLYECDWPAGRFAELRRFAEQAGAPCYSPEMPPDWERCLTPVIAWAVGSEGEMFPDHVGLPLAMDERATFFMLEVHYDNPSFKKAKDNSGLDIFYTEALRRFDGGVLETGVTVTPLHVIPPQQPEYRTAGYCNAACTGKTLPQGGVRVVSVLLHSHLAGRRLRLRHLRGRSSLPDLARDDRYDFRYQQSRRLASEVTLLPGDELVTECAYNTSDRRRPTFGGYSTKQEMCLAFVLYYPRSPVAACLSMTPVKYFFWAFGVSQFYDTDMDTVERDFLKLETPDPAKKSENALAGAVKPRTTTTTTALPNFAVSDPDLAMDEELNRQAIQALKKMKGFTEEGVSPDVAGEPGGGGGGLLGELVIREPSEFRNKTFAQHLRQLPWDQILLTRSLERSLYRGEHMVFCRMPDDQLAIPAAVYNFPNFTEPTTDGSDHNSTCGERLHGSTGAAVPGRLPAAVHRAVVALCMLCTAALA